MPVDILNAYNPPESVLHALRSALSSKVDDYQRYRLNSNHLQEELDATLERQSELQKEIEEIDAFLKQVQ